jgi:hypothetical protein
MKRNYFRLFVVSLFVASFGVAAQAGEPDRLLVNIPYDFVVSGKTLPAGAYRVSRLSEGGLQELAIRSVETGSTVIALSSEIKSVSSPQPKITLLGSGEQHFLSQIQTADHIFTIPVSKSALAEATAESGRGSYVSVTSESRKH